MHTLYQRPVLQGKRSDWASVTGIYMACLNLPLDIQYGADKMYLVGVIPGPKKPSLKQINNFLRVLVNELLKFWEPGVFFS